MYLLSNLSWVITMCRHNHSSLFCNTENTTYGSKANDDKENLLESVAGSIELMGENLEESDVEEGSPSHTLEQTITDVTEHTRGQT